MEKRIKHIEGIRFIAVLLVLIHHWLIIEPLKYLPFGSTISFVLSSFLIGRILLNFKEIYNFKTIILFYIRRAIRIFPAYLMLIISLYLINIGETRKVFHYLISFTINFPMVTKGNFIGNLGHLWSVSVQEQYYFVIPFILFYLPLRLIKYVCYFGILLGLLYRMYAYHSNLSFWHLHVSTLSCIDTFATGTLISYWSVYEPLRFELITKNRKILLAVIIFLVILSSFGTLVNSSNFQLFNIYRVFERSIVSILCIWLLGYAYFDMFSLYISKFLNSKPIIFFGKISFGIYLYHFFVASIVSNVLTKFNLESLDRIRFMLPLYLILTISAATLSWFILEKPFNKLKTRFY